MRTLIITAALLLAGALVAPAASADEVSSVRITRAANWQTVPVYLGQTVTLALRNVWWEPAEMRPGVERESTSPWFSFTDSDTAVLAPNFAAQDYTERAGNAPGKYVGMTTVNYTATEPGTVTLTALSETRVRCGGYTNCPRWDLLNHYSVTVTVIPRPATATPPVQSPA